MNFLQTIIELSARVTGTANIKGLSSSIKDVQFQAKNATRTFSDLRSTIAGVASVLAVREVALYGKSIIDLADSLDELSEKSGITVESLAGISRVASVEGIEVEKLGTSFVKLANKIEDARGGSDSAIRLFKNLGVTLSDTNGRALSTDEIFFQIADQFQKTADGAGKASIATDIFGKSGAEMIPVLNKGSQALKEFSGSISTKFAKDSAEFNDNLKRLSGSLRLNIAKEMPNLISNLNSLTLTLQAVTSEGSAFLGVVSAITGTIGLLSKAVEFVIVRFELLTTGFKVLGVAFDSVFNKKSLEERLQVFKSGIAGVVDSTKSNFARLNNIFSGSPEEYGPKPPPGFDKPPPPSNDKRSDIETRMEREANAIEKLKQEITGLKNTRDLDRKAIELTAFEYDKLKIEIEEKNKAEKESVNFTKENKKQYMELTDEVIRLKKEFIDLKQAQSESFSFGAKEALRDYLQSARDVATQTKNLFSRAFLGMEDAIVQFVQTGKLSFADLARQIEADLIRIAIRQAVVFGINSALGGTDVVRTFSGSSAGAKFGGLGGNYQFANGGIMTEFGSVPLRKYASGGIANRPQMALFGEGSMPEAYVPLPDGRSIPVTMNGGNGSISVVVNVGAGGNDVQGANDPRSKELGNVIASAVKNQILIEKRPGGLLYA